MLKTLLILQFVVILLIKGLFASPVDTAQAKKVATNFYLQNNRNKSLAEANLQLVYVSTSNDINSEGVNSEPVNLFFVYNINKKGFIIVAADDNAKPVLGYSKEGNFIQGNEPETFNELIDNYRHQIMYIKQNNLKANNTIQAKWKTYSQSSFKLKDKSNKSGKDSAGPLLTTTWNQAPYYNALCPSNSEGLTVTGCTATAMAQIMKFWNHPVRGTGQHSYYHPEYGELSVNYANTVLDWADMPSALTDTSTAAQLKAVATLMLVCGVSVDMDYNVTGSGGFLSHVVEALKNNFYYSPNIQFVSKYNYSDSAWINLLENELNNGRPVQCQGFGGTEGHSWVCDGYDSNDYMHYNWGWGGMDNGYFSVDNLNPDGYDFNYEQKIIIGIQPVTPHDLKLALNSNISVTPDSISYNKPFIVNADIKNIDTTTFYGRYAAYLYNQNNTYFLIDSTSTDTLNSNSTGNPCHLTFSSKGIPSAIPGNYRVGILYRTINGNWLGADSVNFKNYVNVKIVNPSCKLKLHTAISISCSPVIQTTPFGFSTKIENSGPGFTGSVYIVLYSEAGDSLLTLATVSNVKIDSAKYDTITFNKVTINNIHGSYLLGVVCKDNSNNCYHVASGIYCNPMQIIVNAHTMAQDKYEPDNTMAYAYNLKPVFTGDSANVNTEGANINVAGDLDFYKVELAKGYDYVITAWVGDMNHSLNGQVYTTDVYFAYRNGNFWSDAYFDTQTMNINVKDSAVIYFLAYSCYQSELGTYLLNINIKRYTDAGIQNNVPQISNLKIFPNPAKDYLVIQLPNNNEQMQALIRIYNNFGQMISEFLIHDSQYTIQTANFADGMYYLETVLNDKKYSNKFIIRK